MTIPLISFGGLATGLDTNAIIASLVAVEHKPIDLMLMNKAIYQNKISSFDTFKTHLKALKDAANALKDDKDFNIFTTSTSVEGILEASASSAATPGAYNIEVTQLAAFEQEASQNFADKDETFIGSGTLTITVGGEAHDILIDNVEGEGTLQGISNAINAAGIGVTATIIDDGSANPYRLVLTGDETGSSHTISVDDSGLSGGTGLTFTELQAARNAEFSINGLDIVRESNQVKDILPGLSLTLTGVTEPGQPVILSVEHDTEAVAEKIKTLVSAYNEVMSFINTQNTYAEEAGSPALMGESMLRRAQRHLQSVMVPDWETEPGAPEIQILAQIGIHFQDDGTLLVTDSELESAVMEHFDDIKTLFSKDGAGGDSLAGIADAIDTMLYEYTKVQGFIESTNENFQTYIKSLDHQISRAEDRLDNFELMLVKKFAALESLMSGLQSQQAYLSTLSIYQS